MVVALAVSESTDERSRMEHSENKPGHSRSGGGEVWFAERRKRSPGSCADKTWGKFTITSVKAAFEEATKTVTLNKHVCKPGRLALPV